MHQIKKRFSTRFRERLADPVFFLMFLGFLFFFIAFVTGFKMTSIQNVFRKEPKPAIVNNDVTKYIAFIYDHRNKLLKKLAQVDSLMARMDTQSPIWKQNMEKQVEEIIVLCNEALKIEPPESFKEFHELYSLALIKYKEQMECLDPGADNYVFASDIEDANKLKKTGDKYFKEAFEKFNQINKTR